MLKLESFQQAKERLDKVLLPTPLIYSEAFSKECKNQVYLKPENLQRTGAFKIRGAYNKIVKLDEESKKKGLIASSAGNHAKGVAKSKSYQYNPYQRYYNNTCDSNCIQSHNTN